MTIQQPHGTVDILALNDRALAHDRLERIGTTLVGSILGGAAFLRGRTATRVALGVAGGLLIARGISGLSLGDLRTALKNLWSNRSDLERRFNDGEHDIVDAASFDSFPASDPPSYSPGAS
jgi:hypothetical protein